MGNPTETQIKEFVSKVKEGNFTEEQSSKLLQLVKDKPTEEQSSKLLQLVKDKPTDEQFKKAIESFEEYATANQKEADEKHNAEELAKKEAEQKASNKTEEIDPLKDFGRYLESSKEAQEFYTIAVLTGDLSASQEPSELEKRQFLSDFEVWLKAGKPRPTMPKIPKGKVRVPTAAYRLKDRDSDKLYVYYDDGFVLGKTEQHFMKKSQDPTTGDVIETDEIDDTRKPVTVFDLNFTTKKAQEIIDEANKLVAPGKTFALYFFHKGNKNTISEKNFVKSYDEVAEMLEKKQSID